jgi:LmbE family N-acetylglucosaminyl deacetylase
MLYLGAEPVHEEFYDAVYRRKVDGAWLCSHDQAMFDQRLEPEPHLEYKLAKSINTRCEAVQADLLLTCAAIGNHRDHILTKKAVSDVAQKQGIPALLWEDLPYALGFATAGHMTGYRQVIVAADESAWEAKWRAIEAYPSQIWMLWREEDWQSLLKNHALGRGHGKLAELFWQSAAW